MKKLMTALALAALVASPALADSSKSANSSKSKARMSAQQSYAAGNAGYDAFAAADPNVAADSGLTIGGPAIFVNGVYAGWDPDPAIRLQLMRDPGLLAD